MTDALVGLAIAGFCLGIYKIANGRLAKKVSQDTCKANVDGIHKLFKEHKEHIDTRFDGIHTRFDDLKKLIKNGGKEDTS